MFEINLVPELKEKAIKAIKLRNLIFFACIVIVAACVAVLMVLLSIKGGQEIVKGGQEERLNSMSAKIRSFDDLDELLTVQAQLQQLGILNGRKMTLSRIFNVLDTLLPTNGDIITISELSVNLNDSTISFDAQAQAMVEPYINYNVLNAFKQSMSLMRYDYGRYVDEEGNAIPTLCLKEMKRNGQDVAIWARGATGCDPMNNEDNLAASNEEAKKIFAEAEAEPQTEEKIITVYTTADGREPDELGEDEKAEMKTETSTRWTTIYRVPQFSKWYEKDYISLEGGISGVPHFDSVCIAYEGIEDEDAKGNTVVKWSSDNSCELVTDDISITNSSDGRNSEGQLVLRFSSTIPLNPEVFAFNNKHMMTIGPTGKTDVTDSYIQIEGMFAERAADCVDGCKTSYEEN